MRADLKRRLLQTTAAQVIAIVVLAVIVGVVATALALTAVAGSAGMRMDPDVKAASEAARIATIVGKVRAAPSSAAPAIVASVRSTAGSVELAASPHAPSTARASAFVQRIVAHLRTDWRLEPSVASDGVVEVSAGTGRYLVFHESEFQTLKTFLTAQSVIALALILLVITALALYAVRSITRPLTVMAEAARAFAHSPDDDSPLTYAGPAEVRQLAAAFASMRDRTRRLLHDRAQMMAAISHDMRTPLTRLRLRADLVINEDDRIAMLADVALMEEMIREALAYLRDGRSAEQHRNIDLPAILRTICGQAQDMGHRVEYSGPSRLTYHGQPGALHRAIGNVVDNATKHGDAVLVTLSQSDVGSAILVSDDGPGIPAELRSRVFEPFFKVNSARTAQGFGLGLSIAKDIVERHHGTIELHDNAPRGLCVRISLPAASSD